MMENSASPRGEASAPIVAVELSTRPATGAVTCVVPPSGCASRARLDHDVRDLQAGPIRAHIGLVARNDDAERLDHIGEAVFRSLQHRDGRALRCLLGRGIVGGKGGGGEGESKAQRCRSKGRKEIAQGGVTHWSSHHRFPVLSVAEGTASAKRTRNAIDVITPGGSNSA
jgi:hypothetical protein